MWHKYGLVLLWSSIILLMINPALAKDLAGSNVTPKSEMTVEDRVIPFRLSNGKIVLTAEVGDSGPLNVILDSGMGWDGILIYNPDKRHKINLIDPKEAYISGAGKGESPSSRFSESMTFTVGGREFRNQKVVILLSDTFKGFPTDGVVGYSIFGHHAVEIDYEHFTLTLHDFSEVKVDQSWQSVPLFFKEYSIPWVDIIISVRTEDPVSFSCYLDTADREAIVLLTRDGQSFTVPEEAKEFHLGRGLNGDIFGKRSTLSRVLFGPYELKNITAAFVPAEVRSKQPNAEGVIGNGLLKRFDLIFDYEHKLLHFKPNEHFSTR